MKTITTTSGHEILLDDTEVLPPVKWSITADGYAKNGKYGYLHRYLLNTPKGKQVDHINGNRLDNRRENLREATAGQNHINSPKMARNTSGYKGVSWSKQNKKWRAKIGLNNGYKYLGHFSDKVEAAKAYDRAVKQYFGGYGHLNFP